MTEPAAQLPNALGGGVARDPAPIGVFGRIPTRATRSLAEGVQAQEACANSSSETAIANPSARVMFPAAVTTLTVPTKRPVRIGHTHGEQSIGGRR